MYITTTLSCPLRESSDQFPDIPMKILPTISVGGQVQIYFSLGFRCLASRSIFTSKSKIVVLLTGNFATSLIDITTFPVDPSVTVELTHKNEILQQLQVKTKRKTLTLEEEFSFEVATNTSCTLENFGVQFTVLHHDFIRGNEIVGQVRLAMDAPLQSEVKHWTAVVLSPHKPIAEWHKLHAPLQ